jgi:dTDP-3,4-didehydro-2,6-dideoxy-alpha-D-glucose 3-reductase
MKKLRLGILGGASIAKRLMIPAIKSLPTHFELVALASRTKHKADEFAAMFGMESIEGYDNLIDRTDIDAIYMPLPTGVHEEWVLKCLSAGKHVLVEKSVAIDFASAERMVDMARANDLLIMENFMFQFHSQHQWVWDLLAANEIGSMRLFRAQFGFPPLDKKGFRYNKNDGGGALIDAGAYTVKASRWFLKTPLQVTAAAMFVDLETGVDIFGNATLMNDQGLTAQVSYGFDNFYQCNYEIWGSKGKIVVERSYTPKPDEKPFIVLEKHGLHTRNEMDADNHFANLLKEFYLSVQNKDHARHLDEVLEQSRVLSEIEKKAVKIAV